MSTRAIYTFKGFGETYHIYKHHDGYPSGAARWLGNALAYAWELPRYEPDDFAAAFVAGNKSGGGGIRIAKSRTSARDVEFGYTVYPLEYNKQSDFPQLNVGELMIDVVSTDYWDGKKEMLLWKGPLRTFITTSAQIEEEYYAR
jgi:hypothetical protein